MAKKQDKNKGLMSQDFLGDINDMVNQPTGGGLYEKLARFERQKALQPLADQAVFSAGLKPVVQRIKEAEDQIKASMTAYIAANPDIDDSLLFDGTSDIVTGTMKQNSDEYRKLSRQIAFLDPSSAKYETIVNKMNKINSTTAQFRDDNKKLLAVRNLMKEEDRVNRISGGNDPFDQAMYDDILTGKNKDRFQNIDGQLYYVLNGEKKAIKDIDAGGPTMENDVAFVGANALLNTVRDMESLNQQDLMFKINNMYNTEGFGNAGIKSLMFDGVNIDLKSPHSPNGAMFNTFSWWESLYKDLGIENDQAAQALIQKQIKEQGVTSILKGAPFKPPISGESNINVRDHFTKWYAGKLTEVHGEIQKQKLIEAGLSPEESEEEANDLIKALVPQPNQSTSTQAEPGGGAVAVDEVVESGDENKEGYEIIDSKPFGRSEVITLEGVTEKEYKDYMKIPTFFKSDEQKKLKIKVEEAIKKAKQKGGRRPNSKKKDSEPVVNNNQDSSDTSANLDFGLSAEAEAELYTYGTAGELQEAYENGEIKNPDLVRWVELNINNTAI
jgi:hypothetical protein